MANADVISWTIPEVEFTCKDSLRGLVQQQMGVLDVLYDPTFCRQQSEVLLFDGSPPEAPPATYVDGSSPGTLIIRIATWMQFHYRPGETCTNCDTWFFFSDPKTYDLVITFDTLDFNWTELVANFTSECRGDFDNSGAILGNDWSLMLQMFGSVGCALP